MTEERLNLLEHRVLRLEDAMNVLKQDWLDTQSLLPTKREVKALDEHLHKQDKLMWALIIAVLAGLIVAYLTGHG